MMTQDEIIEMANKVGCKSYSPPPTRSVAGVSMTFAQVEAFAKLIDAKATAKERERLAQEARECGGALTLGAILAGGEA